jgi:hypothetical protein
MIGWQNNNRRSWPAQQLALHTTSEYSTFARAWGGGSKSLFLFANRTACHYLHAPDVCVCVCVCNYD